MSKSTINPMSKPLEQYYESFPLKTRQKLLVIRELIFAIAKESKEIAEIEESLKWGQASYSPRKNKIGTPIRLGKENSTASDFAIYFHCQTDMVDRIKEIFGKTFSYEGNRALIFNNKSALPKKELRHCLAMALRYHLDKKSK